MTDSRKRTPDAAVVTAARWPWRSMPPTQRRHGHGDDGGRAWAARRRKKGRQPVPEVKYEPTVWGRYAKVLLSSSEFVFIN